MVKMCGGVLLPAVQEQVRRRYRAIIQRGLEETGGIELPRPPGKRGKLKKSTRSNLLERLWVHEDDVLRFMTGHDIPFTNNLAERDLRMLKVKLKISGCYRTEDSAKKSLTLRSYIMTCKKNGIRTFQAILFAFEGQTPEFIKNWESCGSNIAA
jgi:transposase